MNIVIIAAIGKNKLDSLIAVIDAGDSLLIYAVSMAKTASLPNLGESTGNSFTSCVEAAIEWYTSRADKAFAEL